MMKTDDTFSFFIVKTVDVEMRWSDAKCQNGRNEEKSRMSRPRLDSENDGYELTIGLQKLLRISADLYTFLHWWEPCKMAKRIISNQVASWENDDGCKRAQKRRSQMRAMQDESMYIFTSVRRKQRAKRKKNEVASWMLSIMTEGALKW